MSVLSKAWAILRTRKKFWLPPIVLMLASAPFSSLPKRLLSRPSYTPCSSQVFAVSRRVISWWSRSE